MMKKIIILLFASLLSLKAADKPNILFIFADDMSLEAIGSNGKTCVKTPHLDKLRAQGANFSHTYNMGAWNGAVCMASRAMMISGSFVNRAQESVKKNITWPEMMSKAGYTAYMTGKWHVSKKANAIFDHTKNIRSGMPRDVKDGYNRPLSPEHYAKGWKPWDKSKGGFWQGGTHWSEVEANTAIDFIAQAKKDTKPFFMYIAFNATHDPRQAPKEFIDMYPLENIKVPKNFLPNYPYDTEIGCPPKRLRDERLMPSPRTEYAVKVHRQEYFALATHMDQQIGRIFDALEKSGMADNTYIIFTADHGLSVGSHGLVGKQSMYDHSMKVPFFISGPGIKPGSEFDMPIYLQDTMATALEIAKVDKPNHVEFNSVLPLIRGEKKVQYPSIYGKYVNSQRMIAKGDYKLIMYPKANKVRLFNTTKDPEEMNDLADDPKYKEIQVSLKAEFLKLQKQMDDKLDVDKVPAPTPNKKAKNEDKKKLQNH